VLAAFHHPAAGTTDTAQQCPSLHNLQPLTLESATWPGALPVVIAFDRPQHVSEFLDKLVCTAHGINAEKNSPTARNAVGTASATAHQPASDNGGDS
jgi:hypothetical protein